MKRPSIAVLALALLAAAAVRAAPAPAPSRAAVRALLRAALPDARLRVSKVLPAVADGRFPALFVVTGEACVTDRIGERPEERCAPSTTPHVALVEAGADGTPTLLAHAALPTAEAPWDVVSTMGWGAAQTGDFDRDGRPELLVLYRYDGPMQPALGNTTYKDLAVVNLGAPLTIAAHVGLRQLPQASTKERIDGRHAFVAAPGAAPETAPDLRVVATVERPSEERAPRTVTTVLRYDAAADAWRAPTPDAPR